jgi:hypothetical protein
MLKYYLLFLILLTSYLTNGQNLHVEGRILDAQTRIPVSKATILIDQKFYTADDKGLFSIYHPGGKFKISIKSGDFNEMSFFISINSDTTLVLYYEKILEIDEVKVVGSRISGFKKSESLEITKLTPAEISFFPGLGSTVDLLKEIQLLPGVQSGGEGSSGLIVRGGQYDQNLFNLDGFPIYQPYHLSGFLSSIDPFVISDIEIMKGGFPSKYGGKLSSVVNFNTNKQILDSVLSSIDAGILISGVATRFSTDIFSSISISGRFGTMFPLNKTLGKIVPAFPFYNFYDINLNASRKLNVNNDISFTFYLNKDFIKKSDSFTYTDKGIKSTFDNIVKSGWNDMLAGISWINKSLNNIKIQTNLFYQEVQSESEQNINLTLYDQFEKTQNASTTNSSHIREIGLTNDYQFIIKKHNFNYGLFSYIRTVRPIVGTFLYNDGELQNQVGSQNLINTSKLLIESGIYLEDQYYLNEKTILRPGIRVTLLTGIKTAYFDPQPRLYVSYKLTNKISLMGSYTITTQNVQKVSSSNAMVVNDLWVPVTNKIKPSKSYQGEVGFYYNPGRSIRCEVSLFYKKMKDIINYKEGASFVLYPNWEDNITNATGKSIGAEVLVQANFKSTFILFAYTLSKTTRQSPEINSGKVFRYKYDKPSDLNITLGYRVNKKLSISCNWILQSGNMISFYDRIIQADYLYNPQPFLGNINNIRFPYYHRLDLGLERKKITKWGKKILKLDVYNVYSKLNPWYLTTDNGQVKQVALFPIIPSVSYRVEF